MEHLELRERGTLRPHPIVEEPVHAHVQIAQLLHRLETNTHGKKYCGTI